MPNTYKKIASVVVGSGGSSSINFTNIPQTFTDLKIYQFNLITSMEGGETAPAKK
jgi:hypothetical protein